MAVELHWANGDITRTLSDEHQACCIKAYIMGIIGDKSKEWSTVERHNMV